MAKKKRNPEQPLTWKELKVAKGKERLKLLWHFIWYEESLASWIVNIILAFVLIKFILYPGLGLILGTPFPVVAVVSSSMEHHPGSFEEWWPENEDFYLSKNITKANFASFPFRNGFNKGDIMVLAGVDPTEVKLGTVIVYWSRKPYPIIHRYIGPNEEQGEVFLTSKGDNNPRMVQGFELNEYRIQQNQVVGKAILRIPWLGYVKIWAVEAVQMLLPG